MGEWQEPKTDWTKDDRFNIGDYNRIKNNLDWLCEKAKEIYDFPDMPSLGKNITSYLGFWNPESFNAIENRLDDINKNIYRQNFGAKKTYYVNGAFIKYDELNRIEQAILSMRNVLVNQSNNIPRLDFRLGSMKGLRV